MTPETGNSTRLRMFWGTKIRSTGQSCLPATIQTNSHLARPCRRSYSPGMVSSVNRKLAAVLAIDVVGFSRLMAADEVATLKRLSALHKDLVRPAIRKHDGRIVKLMGDGLLAEFASVVRSVECALEIQSALKEQTGADPADSGGSDPILLRMGLNFGDIIVDTDDIFGDGVNIASRLEALAPPGGLCISGKVHDEVKGRLEALFYDLGDQTVKNIDRPVRVWQWAPVDGGATATRAAPAARNGITRPSIAVLPFENMEDAPDHAYFSDGIAEDITTELSRFGSLLVVSRHSAFQYRGNALDIRQVGRELGAQFLLTGSVRRIGDRLRVSVQLNLAEDGKSVWAERFDRERQDLFALQDEITEKVASTAAGQVKAIDTERARRKNPNNLEAYDYFLKGLDLHKGSETGLETARAAVSMFDRAIELDRDFARAYAWRACAFANTWENGKTDTLIEEALTGVQTAIQLDANESEAHRILGAIYLTKRDYDRAEKHYARAGALNPNDSDIMAQTANFYSFVGQPDEALASIRRAMDLNPHHPDWYWSELGLALFTAGTFPEALDAFLNMASPGDLDLALMATTCALTGQNEEAAGYARRLLAGNPELTIGKILDREPFRRLEDRQNVERGLRIAGLQDGAMEIR